MVASLCGERAFHVFGGSVKARLATGRLCRRALAEATFCSPGAANRTARRFARFFESRSLEMQLAETPCAWIPHFLDVLGGFGLQGLQPRFRGNKAWPDQWHFLGRGESGLKIQPVKEGGPFPRCHYALPGHMCCRFRLATSACVVAGPRTTPIYRENQASRVVSFSFPTATKLLRGFWFRVQTGRLDMAFAPDHATMATPVSY